MTAGVPVLVYTRTGCPYCDALRSDLAGRGVAFREVDVGTAPEVIPELLKLTGGRRVVPVLVDGTRIEVAPRGGSAF